jgi:hypothetical protein
MSTYIYTAHLGLLDDIEVTIEYDYSPGTRGKLTGPWEDCYPAEGAEITITDVICPLLTKEGLATLSEILQNDDNLLCRIEEQEIESAQEECYA